MTSRLSRWIHESTFIRTLYYIKIRSPFAFRYNYVYPLATTALVLLAVHAGPIDISLWRDGGISTKLSPLLAVLFPFYVAALAAVSTFPGSSEIDKPFPPDSKGVCVTLAYPGRGGVVVPHKITQRHFLSLLFGYCCVLSVVLLLLSSISAPIAAGLKVDNADARWWTSNISFAIYIFIFFQMITLTLLAIYYLSDKIHRRSEPTGDDMLTDDHDEKLG